MGREREKGIDAVEAATRKDVGRLFVDLDRVDGPVGLGESTATRSDVGVASGDRQSKCDIVSSRKKERESAPTERLTKSSRSSWRER